MQPAPLSFYEQRIYDVVSFYLKQLDVVSRSGGLRPPPQATSDFCKQQNPLNPFNPKSVGDIKSYSLDALFSGGAAVSAAPTK